ncbi:MAG: response regulator [Kangiellaceae bacterium]|nr:response regulator [Kangiellaceae bacterium]
MVVNQALVNKKVLLVDDNDVNLMVARTMLQRAGILVETAENGAIAIEQIQTTQFDAVLMDIQMPVMDGLQATIYIRNTLQITSIPIIALSANQMESDIQKSFEAGMVAHLGKPIGSDLLLETLEYHISQTYH